MVIGEGADRWTALGRREKQVVATPAPPFLAHCSSNAGKAAAKGLAIARITVNDANQDTKEKESDARSSLCLPTKQYKERGRRRRHERRFLARNRAVAWPAHTKSGGHVYAGPKRGADNACRASAMSHPPLWICRATANTGVRATAEVTEKRPGTALVSSKADNRLL